MQYPFQKLRIISQKMGLKCSLRGLDIINATPTLLYLFKIHVKKIPEAKNSNAKCLRHLYKL